eukprot:gene15568-786_t
MKDVRGKTSVWMHPDGTSELYKWTVHTPPTLAAAQVLL